MNQSNDLKTYGNKVIKAFSSSIKKERLLKGISQAEICKKSGIDLKTLQLIEDGKAIISIKDLNSIISAINSDSMISESFIEKLAC